MGRLSCKYAPSAKLIPNTVEESCAHQRGFGIAFVVDALLNQNIVYRLPGNLWLVYKQTDLDPIANDGQIAVVLFDRTLESVFGEREHYSDRGKLASFPHGAVVVILFLKQFCSEIGITTKQFQRCTSSFFNCGFYTGGVPVFMYDAEYTAQVTDSFIKFVKNLVLFPASHAVSDIKVGRSRAF